MWRGGRGRLLRDRRAGHCSSLRRQEPKSLLMLRDKMSSMGQSLVEATHRSSKHWRACRRVAPRCGGRGGQRGAPLIGDRLAVLGCIGGIQERVLSEQVACSICTRAQVHQLQADNLRSRRGWRGALHGMHRRPSHGRRCSESIGQTRSGGRSWLCRSQHPLRPEAMRPGALATNHLGCRRLQRQPKSSTILTRTILGPARGRRARVTGPTGATGPTGPAGGKELHETCECGRWFKTIC